MRSALSFFLLLLSTVSARAELLPLPYSARTLPYSGWTPASRGDTNTIGMGGATLALSSSISAAESNPAGYAMVSGSLSAQINQTTFEDRRLQRSGESIRSREWGLAVSPPPWGFSIAYYTPISESGTYGLPATGQAVTTEVSLGEYRATAARAFLDQTLSIGVGIQYLQAYRELADQHFNSSGWGTTWGLLYRLPLHVIVGASWSPAVRVAPSGNGVPLLPGFDQPVLRPSQLGGGVGWLPNRFFKVGASLTYVGATENTALLADQAVRIGEASTWVPRFGVSYVLAEYTHFKSEAAAGSYFEQSRLSGQSNRLHMTAALEANPYFVNVGAGFDLSSGYQNFMLSVGIDIVRTLRTLKIIPNDPVPPANQAFPTPGVNDPNGLPEGVTHGEGPSTQGPSVKEIGRIIKETPGNIAAKVNGEPTTVEVQEKAKKAKHKKKKKKSPASN